ncbi:GNAT family N-acetyltransferase [Actinoplanes teichomyceticus]|uniref:GNAT family N-acetyltransferase n=1 Tax=Actinoplanes teichomyceticus TaxID=1867 RepID=UPI001EF3C83C|nr:GNAT family N-acetyltransferase [Actinoplanes teichomyceticus]
MRELDRLAEWTAGARLYRAVFGYTEPEFGLSPRLLAGLRDNGGTVLGAFRGDGELVGFCFGFSAVSGGELYHYSQAAVVAAGARGAGVGRLLKYAQAAAARRTGARTMRWVFDPYALRNAHFNLAVLGATGVGFQPDFYAEPGTDRVVVSWDLDRAVPDVTGPAPLVRVPTEARCSIVVAAGQRYAAPDPADRAWLRQELLARFAAGARLVGVVRLEAEPGRAAYLFEPGEAA